MSDDKAKIFSIRLRDESQEWIVRADDETKAREIVSWMEAGYRTAQAPGRKSTLLDSKFDDSKQSTCTLIANITPNSANVAEVPYKGKKYFLLKDFAIRIYQ